METKKSECLRVNIDTSDQDFSVDLTVDMTKFNLIKPAYLHFTLNYNNISSQFGNNILYLNNAATQSITLQDGCYDIEDINTYHLQNILFTKYFKIHPRFDGQGYGLYSYLTTSDRASYTNGTLITYSNYPSLNSEIQYGEFRPTQINLVSQIFDIHASSKTNTRDGLIIIPASQG